jgi:hypothetical protein
MAAVIWGSKHSILEISRSGAWLNHHWNNYFSSYLWNKIQISSLFSPIIITEIISRKTLVSSSLNSITYISEHQLYDQLISNQEAITAPLHSNTNNSNQWLVGSKIELHNQIHQASSSTLTSIISPTEASDQHQTTHRARGWESS